MGEGQVIPLAPSLCRLPALGELVGDPETGLRTGNQSPWGEIRRVVYPGPMRAFFESCFPNGKVGVSVGVAG